MEICRRRKVFEKQKLFKFSMWLFSSLIISLLFKYSTVFVVVKEGGAILQDNAQKKINWLLRNSITPEPSSCLHGS